MIATQTRRSLLVLAVFALAVTSAGCGNKPCPSAPQPPAGAAETASPVAGPGQIDPEIAKVAYHAEGVYKLKLRVDPNGRVTKIAVYHRDASKVAPDLLGAAHARFADARVVSYENEHYAGVGATRQRTARAFG